MLRAFLDRLYAVSGVLATICLGLIGALVLAQIIGRQLGVIVPSADDFAGYAMAASAFLGLAYAFRRGAHIRVTLLLGRYPPGWRRVMELALLVIATATSAYLAWHLTMLTWESFVFDDRAMGIVPTPLWIPQSVMALGAMVMVVACVDELAAALRGRMPGYAAAEAEETAATIGQREG